MYRGESCSGLRDTTLLRFLVGAVVCVRESVIERSEMLLGKRETERRERDACDALFEGGLFFSARCGTE